MWRSRVQELYATYEELVGYDKVYSIAERCGYPRTKELWNDNPMLTGGIDPSDFRLAKPLKYRFEGTYRKQNAMGDMQKFTVQYHGMTALQAMDVIRDLLYKSGYDSILFKKAFSRVDGRHRWEEMNMMEALGLE